MTNFRLKGRQIAEPWRWRLRASLRRAIKWSGHLWLRLFHSASSSVPRRRHSRTPATSRSKSGPSTSSIGAMATHAGPFSRSASLNAAAPARPLARAFPNFKRRSEARSARGGARKGTSPSGAPPWPPPKSRPSVPRRWPWTEIPQLDGHRCMKMSSGCRWTLVRCARFLASRSAGKQRMRRATCCRAATTARLGQRGQQKLGMRVGS
mmetsp:Transcript_120203/g.256534  ORF Transcript_120203/g.256534 Transcript_120203/m.256534 type:complete len:208 (+) Transcript_120203:765-1388(+)